MRYILFIISIVVFSLNLSAQHPVIRASDGFVFTPSGGGGTGTVTSVGLYLPVSVFTVTGSPVTTSGTLSGSFTTQTANTFFAGPSSGAASVPTFRTITTADLPAGLITSIGPFQTATNSNGLSLTGSAISLHAASASTPGGVSVVQQTFGAGTGNKVFSSDNALQVKCDDVSGSKSAGIGFSEFNNTVDLGNITVGGDATNSTMTMRIQDATNSTAYITIGSLNDNKGVKEKGGLYEDVKDVTTFPYSVLYGDRNIVVETLNVGDAATLQKIGGGVGETKIGRVLYFHNIGTQILTIQPAAGDTIDGQVNQALGVNKSLRLVAITATQWAMHREF